MFKAKNSFFHSAFNTELKNHTGGKMKNTTFTRAIILPLLLIMMCTFATASDKGTLRVVVIESEGLALPGVTVTLSSPDMKGTKSLISDQEGEAIFVNLFPALYEVKTSLEGFQELISKDIRVRIDIETVVNIVMQISTLQESITVVADYDLVDTKKTTISEHVTHDFVESLPVARDYVGYIQLVAGVDMVPNSQGRETGYDPASKGGLNYWARGARLGSRDNKYLLDGINITGLSSQQAGMTFNNEVIQEQQVMTSGVPAEYGGGKGVVTNIVTKSGGNRLSGSLNLYVQRKGFWGGYTGLAKEDERLQSYKDNKYDTAFTLGGPIMKDRFWFFLSGQYRNDSDKFNLSESASSTQEGVDFTEDRYNIFGKLSFGFTPKDNLTFTYFLDYFDISGSRNKNLVKSRQSLRQRHYMAFNGYYQKVLTANFIVDLRYGHYEIKDETLPRYPDAGIMDTLQSIPGTFPRIEDYMFGSYRTVANNKNTRDQFSISADYFLGDMHLKAGLMYVRETDKDDSGMNYDQELLSLDPNLNGWTLNELMAANVWPYGEFAYRLLPYLNSHWDSTAEYYDINGDGVVTVDELGQATFIAANEHGLNFWRWFQVQRGANTVKALRWAGYITDTWNINKYFTVNAGLRLENHNYRDSEGDEILHMKTIFLPRIGLAWDIGGKGNQKLSLFYGQYSDPMTFRPIHVAGNISGSIRHKQFWLADDWYTYRVYGSAEHRDMVFTPNLKDNYAREFSISYEIDLGGNLLFRSQGYIRQDRNIIEDIDTELYINNIVGDPTWGHLALTWEDFGYPASGPPVGANFFISNLIGAKRNIYGLDFEIYKRFMSGSYFAAQYSFKDARGNSTSDQEMLYFGDIISLDPRNDWMWGRLPGTIPHKIKLFGTYRTPFGLNIGGMFYWNSGFIYTESYLRKDCYINWPLNPQETELAKSGEQNGPGWYQVDLKLNYIYKFTQNINVELFLDIYNFTNNQTGYNVEYARNSSQWAYQQVNRVLNPRRIYLGARFRF